MPAAWPAMLVQAKSPPAAAATAAPMLSQQAPQQPSETGPLLQPPAPPQPRPGAGSLAEQLGHGPPQHPPFVPHNSWPRHPPAAAQPNRGTAAAYAGSSAVYGGTHATPSLNPQQLQQELARTRHELAQLKSKARPPSPPRSDSRRSQLAVRPLRADLGAPPPPPPVTLVSGLGSGVPPWSPACG